MEYWPDTIHEAASSPLGIVALVVLSLSALAVTFFRSAPNKVKLTAFAIIVAAFVSFAFKVTSVATQGPAEVAVDDPSPGPSGPPATQSSGVAYNRVQRMYTEAKSTTDCDRVKQLVQQITRFQGNTQPVPRSAVLSVRRTNSDRPQISDLSADRIRKIRTEHPECF